MKILKLLFLLSMLAAAARGEIFTDVVKLDDATILKNGDGSKVEVSVKLPKTKILAFGAIVVFGEIENADANSSVSLTASIGGKEAAAKTISPKNGPTGAMFVATFPLREATRKCRESAEIKIEMRGSGQARFKVREVGIKAAVGTKYFRNISYLRPIFSGDEMTMESVFPLGCEDPSKPAKAKLLFAPTEILEAYTLASGKKVELQRDKDFKISGDTIEFLPNSNVKIIPYKRMFAKTREELLPYCKPFYFAQIKKYAFFSEGGWFHEHMVYISYKHAATNKKVGEKFDGEKLPRTLKFFKNKKPIRISLYGDSIASGANASALSMAIPYAPSWGDFIAQEISKYYKMPVVFLNRALGGTTSTWGAREAEILVCPDKPDLAIIAFGMNDRIAPEQYAKNIAAIMAKIKKANPEAEFILVSPMSANPDWHEFKMHDEYAKVLREMEADGAVLADVRSVHKMLLAKKRFIDMTGNNVNHPNDFMIRVYAQTILQKLIPAMSK